MSDFSEINNQSLIGFSPTEGIQYNGEFIPKITTIVKLGNDVSISINNVPVNYVDGEILVLRQGIKYVFASATNCHIIQ